MFSHKKQNPLPDLSVAGSGPLERALDVSNVVAGTQPLASRAKYERQYDDRGDVFR
jgi:hypothetical protein